MSVIAPQSNIHENLKHKRLTLEDFEQVSKLVKGFYAAGEPMHVMLGLGGGPVEEERARAWISQGCSIGVYDTSRNELVAFVINSIDYKESALPEVQLGSKREKLTVMLKSVAAGMHDDLKIDKTFSVYMLTVHSDFRKFGLGTDLLKSCDKVASEFGCDSIRVLASSAFVQKVCEKLDYKVYRSVKYEDYVDPESGCKLFTTPYPPHTHIKALYKLFV